MAKFKVQFTRHAGQQEVRDYIDEFLPDVVTVCASRGWGKSIWCTCDEVLPFLLAEPNRQAMWVAPTYKICQSPIDDVWFGVDDDTGERFVSEFDEKTGFRFWEYKKAAGEIHMFNKSKLYVRSATNPESIVSKGYGLIIIDEAALIPKEVFMKQILPTARRKGCKIILISTPRGQNWFYEMYLDGQDKSKPRYASFAQPWWKRPDYPPLLIELMKDMPQRLREQEFEAKFIDNGGGVFINLDHVFYGDEIEFPSQDQMWTHPDIADILKEEEAVLAVDLAKSYDYTVLVALSQKTRKLLYYQRFNKTDYKFVISRIKTMADKLNGCDVIYDGTGVGVGIGDFLEREVNAYPFIFTNQSKADIIQRLMVTFEYANLSMPLITTIKNEFILYEYQITKTGKISYSAPEGKHDDIVVAVAMCNFHIEENGSNDIMEIENFLQVVGGDSGGNSIWDEIANDND